MSWEALGNLDFHYKVLATIATLVTIGSGTITIIWRIKTWDRRRLKLLKEYLQDREKDASDRRQHVLRKIASSLYAVPAATEPNVSKAVENAIHLLDLHHVSAAQTELENLQDKIGEKLDFIERYRSELTRHQANIHLFLAAIADRRNEPEAGLRRIAKAKSVLGEDLDLLKYEGLLRLKEHNWTAARDSFQKLESEATGNENWHYKAVGAKGRGDALVQLGDTDAAIDAYGRALRRIGGADLQHQDPIFNGLVYLSLAQIQENGDEASLRRARDNASEALKAFQFKNGLGVLSDDVGAAQSVKDRAEAALARIATTNRPTN